MSVRDAANTALNVYYSHTGNTPITEWPDDVAKRMGSALTAAMPLMPAMQYMPQPAKPTPVAWRVMAGDSMLQPNAGWIHFTVEADARKYHDATGAPLQCLCVCGEEAKD
jgi:hypothetical protein